MAKCAGILTRVKCANTNDTSVKYHVSDLKRKSIRVFQVKDPKSKIELISNVFYNPLLFHCWFHRQLIYI